MRWTCCVFLVCLSIAASVSAQGSPEQKPAPEPAPAPQSGTSFFDRLQAAAGRQVQISKDHLQLIENVELPIDDKTKLFADQIDLFTEAKRLVAEGNVVFAGSEGRITAEQTEYNVETGTGTFKSAFGIMSLGAMADRKQFGNQDADVYFFGETIERLGPRKYRITRGGFSTCTQPTPRWQMTSESLVLNLDDYAFARNTVLRVKGVPIMYLPIIYYPIQESGRATGFLMPTYATSTTRGQGLSNAFFWAINRSQDATLFHDWYTRAGQGVGTEYRYMASPQSAGDLRIYRFDQKEATYSDGGSTVPASTSYEVTASANHAISRNVRARARVDYFTSLLTQQLYHQDIYQATQNRRTVEAGLTGNFGPLATSAQYQRQETFGDSSRSAVYGSTPRVTANLSPQRLFNAPIYASVNSEYAYLPQQQVTDGVVTLDNSFGRLDVAPTIRVPLSRLTFLSLNTSATYRATRYSRRTGSSSTVSSSTGSSSNLTDEPYIRQYASLRSDIVGPVFTRIWELQQGFAERLKHVIEPAFTFDFTSEFQDYTSTPQTVNDISDFVVAGNTKVTYGLTNRFFYRGRTVDGVRGQTREFVTVGIQQTYYSNPEAARWDSTYTCTSGTRTGDLSPIAFTARVSPTNFFDTNSRLDYDVSGLGLACVSAGGNLNMASASANVNYSHVRSSNSDYIYGGTSMRWMGDRVNVTYSLSWDIARHHVQSQSVIGSYLAQCCGVQVDFQKYNYAQGVGLPADMRWNFGFVLAGLGTFSNFFGAFGAR